MNVVFPDHYELVEEGGYKIIRRQWRSLRTVFLAIFWLVFNILFMPDHVKSLPSWEFSGLLSLLALVPFAIEIGLTYGLAASFLNKTDIAMGRGFVRIKHYPLWWPGQKKINAHDIKQVYVNKKVSHHHNSDNHTSSTSVTYHVNALDRRNKRISLMGGLHDRDEALFIEAKMEEALEIEDEVVKGAVS